ncbi:hypothetical protein CLU79DRAFT_752525 [Phycomyces nitens]|nr:hypothetical protein CLU79DRAFT_752525 [Phycomyces nitens]
MCVPHLIKAKRRCYKYVYLAIGLLGGVGELAVTLFRFCIFHLFKKSSLLVPRSLLFIDIYSLNIIFLFSLSHSANAYLLIRSNQGPFWGAVVPARLSSSKHRQIPSMR